MQVCIFCNGQIFHSIVYFHYFVVLFGIHMMCHCFTQVQAIRQLECVEVLNLRYNMCIHCGSHNMYMYNM